MVKARIPGSSQELYTVSVESVPQYAGGNAKRSGCCKSGRVGKDLLCGVLIALAVICAAVAIFLVVFYVVNGTEEVTAPSDSEADRQNGALDSSPLTRDREEEKKINSLKDSHEWDSSETKDQLSLSSTSLPDVGIHEPEFHVKGQQAVYPPYKSAPTQSSTTEAPDIPETPDQPDTSDVHHHLDNVEGKEKEDDDDSLPIVEAKSQEVDDKTTLFVPDDDVIIETPSGQLPIDPVSAAIPVQSSTTTTTRTTVVAATDASTTSTVDVDTLEAGKTSTTVASDPVIIPVPELIATQVDQSGFVPIREELEPESVTDAQTEVSPDILAVAKPSEGLVIDNAPWKPIDTETAILPESTNATRDEIQGRFIDESSSNSDNNKQSISQDQDKKIISTTTKATTTTTTTPVSPLEVSQVPETNENPQEPEESTDFALIQDLGNMALLVPEDRVRTSSSSTTQPTAIVPSSSTESGVASRLPVEPQCIRRQLPFCRGVLPYSETVLPNWVGDNTESERNFSVPYFEIIAESECHPRVQQYACAVLEPPCRGNGISLPPCRQFCRAIAEDCSSYVLSALTLASVLDCEQFPQSNDPNVCLNLASTTPEGECLPNEYRCSNDNTCIPERWVCDGRLDCSQGDDEFSCNRCRDEEFRCESENRCLPKRWRCDGSRDCADGSDERDCPSNQECGDGQFRCGDGLSCIPLRRVCDGSNHCRDNSDETNCTSIACQIEDFKCRDNGVCISRKWVCDGNEDCKDGSDEAECAREAELDLESDVLIDEMLDGLNGNETSAVPDTAFDPEKCPLGELLCMSGSTCIRFEQLCDGTRDCADGADETDCSKSPGVLE